MKIKKYAIGIIGTLMIMMLASCSGSQKEETINKESEVKSPVIKNLEIEINNKKIDLVNSESGIVISKDLLSQMGGDVESELNGVWEEKQLKVYSTCGDDTIRSRLIIKNLGNKDVKINGIQIGEKREEVKKKWEDEKLETMCMGNTDIAVYNNLCEVECKFEDEKLVEMIYKYNPVEGLASTSLKNLEEDTDWKNLDEEEEEEYDEYIEAKKGLVYPTKFNFSKEEEKEYVSVIQEYENKYGELRVINDRQAYGVCFLKFLDLKEDGTPQLMIGYSDKEEVVDGQIYMNYSFDIWDLEDEKAVKVDSGECLPEDGDYKSFLIIEREGKKYVVSGEKMPECERDQIYHGYKNGEFGIVRHEKKDGIYYAIDGEEMSREDYLDQLWIYEEESKDEFCLNGYWEEEKTELWRDICFVKEVLHMKQDS